MSLPEKVQMERLCEMLRELRKLQPSMRLGQAEAFLRIACEGEVQQGKLSEQTGLKSSTVSRFAATFRQYIQRREDTADRRKQCLSLTHRGRGIVLRLLSAVQGESV